MDPQLISHSLPYQLKANVRVMGRYRTRADSTLATICAPPIAIVKKNNPTKLFFLINRSCRSCSSSLKSSFLLLLFLSSVSLSEEDAEEFEEEVRPFFFSDRGGEGTSRARLLEEGFEVFDSVYEVRRGIDERCRE